MRDVQPLKSFVWTLLSHAERGHPTFTETRLVAKAHKNDEPTRSHERGSTAEIHNIHSNAINTNSATEVALILRRNCNLSLAHGFDNWSDKETLKAS